jgi:hypothetical protein
MSRKCAVDIARMMDANIIDCDLTRPWMDGGRDALGFYRIGPASDPAKVDFALEAECYKLESANGVKHLALHLSISASPIRNRHDVVPR